MSATDKKLTPEPAANAVSSSALFGKVRLHANLAELREKHLPGKIPFPEARLERGVGPKTLDAMIAAGWVDMTPPKNPKQFPWTNHLVRRCARRYSLLPPCQPASCRKNENGVCSVPSERAVALGYRKCLLCGGDLILPNGHVLPLAGAAEKKSS